MSKLEIVKLDDPYVVVETNYRQKGETPINNYYDYSSFLEAYNGFLDIIKEKTSWVMDALPPNEEAEGAPIVRINDTEADISTTCRLWFSFHILPPKEALAIKIVEWVKYCIDRQKSADDGECFVVNFQFIANNDFDSLFWSIVFDNQSSKFCDWTIEWVRREPDKFGEFVNDSIRKVFDVSNNYSAEPGFEDDYCNFYYLKGYCYNPCGIAYGLFQSKQATREEHDKQPFFGAKHLHIDDLPF